MLRCKEISELVSESLDRKLPLWTRWSMWMHLCMCRLCRVFRKDLTHLHRETQRLADESLPSAFEPEVRLPEESRERIKRRLSSSSS